MSGSKADLTALSARVTTLEGDNTVLKAQIEVLKAEIAALKATNNAPSKKGKKEKKEKNIPTAEQAAAKALNKAWIQHCLDTYDYPADFTEAESNRTTELGRTDGLLVNRNHVAFAKAMKTTNSSDYDTFAEEWTKKTTPAEGESVAEDSAASATESTAPAEKKARKAKSPSAAVAKAKASKAPVEEGPSSAAEEVAEEEAPKPVPASGGRKVIKGSKAK